jgi:hypothetical protein
MILIDVWSDFTASHRCAEGELHEHDWEVVATFRAPAYTDARIYRLALDTLLAGWEWTELPPELDWSEDICAAVMKLTDCVDVRVTRQGQRIAVRLA